MIPFFAFLSYAQPPTPPLESIAEKIVGLPAINDEIEKRGGSHASPLYFRANLANFRWIMPSG